ncbi:MAG: hypothetical protein JWM82_2983, partial [Myxococcales bacterium]|nr:hypothetical protein [Myxococcales bacterium]
LWVINATRAAAGVPIKCDTLDASCLRLSTTVLDDPTSHFLGHKFDGDTLIFSEGLNGTPSGDIFAWRPGWTVARKLTSQTGAACVGNKVSTTVLCAQNAQVDATQTKATVEIHAGPVTDANGGALPLLDTFIYATTADAQSDLPRYSFAISPDGGFIAWSGRYEVGGLETLKVQKVGDAASRLTVATGISSWGISPDLTKWFWLKSFNYNGTGTASGSLESAPFPAGTPATPLASNVGDYVWAFSSKWLLFRSNLSPDVGGNGVGTLSFMADHDVPGALAVLDTKVLNVLDVTADGTKVMYSKTQDLLGGTFQVFDLYLAKPDGSPPCTLASTPLVFASPTRPRFLDSGRLAVLGRLNAVTSEGEGLAVNVGACTTTKFAHEIYSWWPVGDEGVVVADDLAAVNGKGEVSLRYALATNATLPATATSIRPHVGTDVAVLLPALPAVMYTIGGTTDAAGLYIDATLPFKTTGPNATRSAPRDLGSAGWPFARSTRFSVRARRP